MTSSLDSKMEEQWLMLQSGWKGDAADAFASNYIPGLLEDLRTLDQMGMQLQQSVDTLKTQLDNFKMEIDR